MHDPLAKKINIRHQRSEVLGIFNIMPSKASYMDPRKRRQIIVFLLLVPLIFLCIIKLHYYLHPMRVSYIVSNDVSRHLKSVKDNIETATHSVFEDTDSKSGKTLR